MVKLQDALVQARYIRINLEDHLSGRSAGTYEHQRITNILGMAKRLESALEDPNQDDKAAIVWEYHTVAPIHPSEDWIRIAGDLGKQGWEAWHTEVDSDGHRAIHFKRPKP